MDDQTAILSELLAVAREQLRWQKAANLAAIRVALVAALPSTETRKVFELCDGSHTFREMASSVGVSVGTVANWTKQWREAALVYEVEGRSLQKLVSLGSLGIPIEVSR